MSTDTWDLWCNPESLFYDFKNKSGVLTLPAGECCDMAACIDLFETIDEDVTSICVIAGMCLDTRYNKHVYGWAAESYKPHTKAPESSDIN